MDNFLSGKEGRDKIASGAKKVVDAVALTLGPGGVNFIAEHTLPPFQITSNDGVTLARAIELDDPYEKIGASIIKEIASKADKVSNDGTTTACVIAGAIIEEGMKSDLNPMQLKRELEACIPIVEQALKAQVREITVSDVGKVASISAEDVSIGAMIQEIYENIGPDGIIFNDASRDFKDSYTLDRGVHIAECGFASPYMGDMTEEGQMTTSANIKNPFIVITKQKINSIKDLEAIGSIAINSKKDLVIFADEVEGNTIKDLVLTRVKGGIRATLIKLPLVYKDWWTEDIAKLTGATVMDPAVGLYLKDFKESMGGTCANVIVDKDNTFLDGTLAIDAHIEELKAKGDDDSLLRAARLNKKTAKYHVGAMSAQALKYRHDKAVDALGAAYHALHGGIVAGGGVALASIADELPDTIGGRLLTHALKAPAQKIADNAGYELKVIGKTSGLNARTGEIVDMFEANIIDAYNTVFHSFKAAVSVASTILTGHVVVILPKREEKTTTPFDPYGQ